MVKRLGWVKNLLAVPDKMEGLGRRSTSARIPILQRNPIVTNYEILLIDPGDCIYNLEFNRTIRTG